MQTDATPPIAQPLLNGRLKKPHEVTLHSILCKLIGYYTVNIRAWMVAVICPCWYTRWSQDTVEIKGCFILQVRHSKYHDDVLLKVSAIIGPVGQSVVSWALQFSICGCGEFLADRILTVALMLASVVVCDVMYCGKRCVLEQKLLLRAYRKSYIRNRLVPKWMTLTSV